MLNWGEINNPDRERERERERRERERPTNQRVTMVSILDGSLKYQTLHM